MIWLYLILGSIILGFIFTAIFKYFNGEETMNDKQVCNLNDHEIHKAAFYLAISPYYLVALWKPEWILWTSVIQGSGLVMFIYMSWVEHKRHKREMAILHEALLELQQMMEVRSKKDTN